MIRRPRFDNLKPLTVPHRTAQAVLGIGPTKYFELIKKGAVKTVLVGRTQMAVYKSLEELTKPTT